MIIAIIDDSKNDRDNLSALLSEYFSEKNLVMNINMFSSAEDFLKNFTTGRFQIVFMDIYLDDASSDTGEQPDCGHSPDSRRHTLNGMEAARKIAKMDSDCHIIFFTASFIHAVSSYEVNATWYLTKPVNKQFLYRALDTACHDLSDSSRYISVKVMGTKLQIYMKDIVFAESQNRQTQIHMQKKILTVDNPISEVLGMLSADDRFLLCNRNVMANMQWVDRAEGPNFIMKNGEIVPLKQRGQATLKRNFLSWSLSSMRRESGF